MTTELDDVDYVNIDSEEIDRLFDEAVRLFWAETGERPTHNINVPKATALLDYLETHPWQHDQAVWGTVEDRSLRVGPWNVDQAEEMALGSCGTTGCAAGWTAALDGHVVGTVGELEGVLLDLLPKGSIVKGPRGNLELDHDQGYDEDTMHAEGYARDALGLSDEQASHLFYATSMTRERIRETFSEWTYGEIPAVRPAA